MSDVCQCLTDPDKSLSKFKRLSRNLELILSPPLKKLNGKHFISLECLVQLMEGKLVSPVSKEFEEQIIALQTVRIAS